MRNFIKNICLFVLIGIFYMLLSVVMSLFSSNIIMHFILTLIHFYYVTFAVVLLFNYYYSCYAKIGSAIDETV